MKEKNIQELAKRMGLVTVEDMCQYTIAQLVVKIANKVNELVDEVWRFESDVQEILKTQNENIQYLLGEGLHLELENIFDGWVQDGTFDTLINQSALKKVNDRIDETNTQLSQLINESNPTFGKLKGANIYIPYNEINGTFIELLQQMKNANCDTLCLCPVLWMSSNTSDVVGYKQGTDKYDVLAKVKIAKEQGFKVVLKPHVGGDGFTGYSSIRPTNIETWLETYEHFLIELATLCKGYIDVFCVGNELNYQTKHHFSTWKAIILKLRNINPSMLISHANHSDEIETNVFLSELDLIGVNVYPPVLGDLSTNIELQRSSLLTQSNELNRVIECSVKHGKDILITECGILPFEDSLHSPSAWGFTTTPPENEDAQVRYYQLAIKELIQANKVKGVMVWNACDGFTFVNRKAQATLKEIFGGDNNE